MRQGAAVRVAQHQAVGARRFGSQQRLDRILGIRLVPVEKMLGIVEDLVHVLFQVGNGIPDHREVLLQRDLERLVHMQVPGFAEDGRNGHARSNERLEARVLGSLELCPAGGAEGDEFRLLQPDPPHLPEELHVAGIGARPAALDVLDAELVEFPGNADHVLDREVHVLCLCPVAEGGVV